MLCEEFAQSSVAAGAAFAGAGQLPQLFQIANRQACQCVDDLAFRHAQTVADEALATVVAGSLAGFHNGPNGRKDSRRVC